MKSLLEKEAFIGLDRCTWLYSGAETPTLRGQEKAVRDYLHSRSLGPGGRDRNTQIEQSCKRNLASLLNSKPEHIALLSNSSEIISMIAQSLDWEAGDNVVIHTLEFPSGVLPWLSLKQKGLEVRIVSHQQWEVPLEAIMDQVDANTRLVVTSHVSYLSGARIDYKRLYRELKQTDALLLLDVTQSFGVVPVDMDFTDFVVSSSYKWLLSTHGVGILGVNPTRTGGFASSSIGWRSVSDLFGSARFDRYTRFQDARRFELGFPSYPSIYALNYSTKVLLDIGIEQIEQHVLSLGDRLIRRLQQLAYEVMTPTDPDKRAGNISFVCEDGEKISEQLFQAGIYAWGGDGRLRASVHLFNDSEDIDTLIHHLENAVHRAT